MQDGGAGPDGEVHDAVLRGTEGQGAGVAAEDYVVREGRGRDCKRLMKWVGSFEDGGRWTRWIVVGEEWIPSCGVAISYLFLIVVSSPPSIL